MLLAHETDDDADWLAKTLAGLDPTADEKGQIREAVLERLARSDEAYEMLHTLARLDPGVRDLTNWRSWAEPPDHDLLLRRGGTQHSRNG
jgi:hypothetical protein